MVVISHLLFTLLRVGIDETCLKEVCIVKYDAIRLSVETMLLILVDASWSHALLCVAFVVLHRFKWFHR